MSSFKAKVWRQLSHVKNQQIKDNESVVSQSRSTNSFKFSKIKFSKVQKKQDKESSGSVKDFGLINPYKNKQKSQQMSILNESKCKFHDQSLCDSHHKQNIGQNKLKFKDKSSTHKRKVNLQSLVIKLKRVHEDLREIAQNLVQDFERIKQEMQINIKNVVTEIIDISFSKKKEENQQNILKKIHEIFSQGFQNIKKSINILPSSLVNFNNTENSNYKVFKHSIFHNQIYKDNSNFNSVLKSPTNNIQRSTKKDIIDEIGMKDLNDSVYHAITQRKNKNIIKVQRMSSFDNKIQDSPIEKFKKHSSNQFDILKNIRGQMKTEKSDSVKYQNKLKIQGQLKQHTCGLNIVINQLKVLINSNVQISS